MASLFLRSLLYWLLACCCCCYSSYHWYSHWPLLLCGPGFPLPDMKQHLSTVFYISFRGITKSGFTFYFQNNSGFLSWLIWGFSVYPFYFRFHHVTAGNPLSLTFWQASGCLNLQSNLVFYLQLVYKFHLCKASVSDMSLGSQELLFSAYPFTSSLLNRFFPPIYVFQHSLQPYWVESGVEAISSNSSQLVIISVS